MHAHPAIHKIVGATHNYSRAELLILHHPPTILRRNKERRVGMVVMLRLFCFPPFHSRGDSIRNMQNSHRIIGPGSFPPPRHPFPGTIVGGRGPACRGRLL